MKKELITHSERETINVGKELGAAAKPGDIFALYGDLGTGKTIIAKGIAKGIEVTDEITSPTFLLVEIYNGRIPLYHFDLYRLDILTDPGEYGFDEYLYGNGISVIEWADKAEKALPIDAVKIYLTQIDSNMRKITIEYPGD